MKKILIVLMACGMILTFGSFAGAAPVSDVINAPTGYFVPTDAQKWDSGYWRWYDEDWGWSHNAIAGPITSAELGISAFDVDYAGGERDIIYAWENSQNGGAGDWVALGELAGGNAIWQFTKFTLSSDFYDDIINGLQVKIDIDSTHTSDTWAVTLAKSVLSVDGGGFPDPDPDPVPEPATMLLLGGGLAGLGVLRRKFRR